MSRVSFSEISYHHTREYLKKSGLKRQDTFGASSKFHLREIAEAEGIDLEPLHRALGAARDRAASATAAAEAAASDAAEAERTQVAAREAAAASRATAEEEAAEADGAARRAAEAAEAVSSMRRSYEDDAIAASNLAPDDWAERGAQEGRGSGRLGELRASSRRLEGLEKV